MTATDHTAALAKIRHNIEHSGFHLYIITGGAVPRFAYTIGLRESLGTELVLAGAIYYSADDIKRIVHTIREQLRAGKQFKSVLPVEGLGLFTLRQAHNSWTRSLMLGALDYYKVTDILAMQIVPDEHHTTIDVPDISREWSAETEPVWQWLHVPWEYKVPRTSTATTNLDALHGGRITEVTRWEAGEWEMFAGPGLDVSDDEARIVPLGCLLAADPSLVPAVELEHGKGLWRDAEQDDWHPWLPGRDEQG
jgi:hypothetical protein